MPLDDDPKPQSRQQRRLEERQKSRAEASPGAQQSQDERGKHRAQLRAAAQGRLQRSSTGRSRQPNRPSNNIVPLSGPSAGPSQPTAQSPFVRMKARQTFASGKDLAEYFQCLDVEDGAASSKQTHSIQNELDLVRAVMDALCQADEKFPLYQAFLADARARCVDVSEQVPTGSDGTVVKGPLILRSKDTEMVDKVERCQINLEMTVDVWDVLFQRLGESMAYWRSPRMDVGKRVADPQQVKLRRDLQLTQDRLEICIRKLLEVHTQVADFMDGIRRGLGQAIQTKRKCQDWEPRSTAAASGTGNG